MSKRTAKCHKCKESVNLSAKVCSNCGAKLVVKNGMFDREELKKTKEI